METHKKPKIFEKFWKTIIPVTVSSPLIFFFDKVITRHLTLNTTIQSEISRTLGLFKELHVNSYFYTVYTTYFVTYFTKNFSKDYGVSISLLMTGTANTLLNSGKDVFLVGKSLKPNYAGMPLLWCRDFVTITGCFFGDILFGIAKPYSYFIMPIATQFVNTPFLICGINVLKRVPMTTGLKKKII